MEKVSTKGNWIQVEAPDNAFAFVAADLIEKESAPEPTPIPEPEPAPAPAPEIVEVPEPVVPAEPIIEEPAPAPPVDEFPEIIAEPAPPATISPEPAADVNVFVFNSAGGDSGVNCFGS